MACRRLKQSATPMSIVTASLWPEPPGRQHPEDDVQRGFVRLLRWSLPADAEFYAVPNGGKRHAREAARMVGLGVRAGIPDIALVHQGRALFVEVKAAQGVLS